MAEDVLSPSNGKGCALLLGIDTVARQSISADTLSLLKEKQQHDSPMVSCVRSLSQCSSMSKTLVKYDSSVVDPANVLLPPANVSATTATVFVAPVKPTSPFKSALLSNGATTPTTSLTKGKTNGETGAAVPRHPSPTKSVRFQLPDAPPKYTDTIRGLEADGSYSLTKTSMLFSRAMDPSSHHKTSETGRQDFIEDKMTLRAVKALDLHHYDWSAPMDMAVLHKLAVQASEMFMHKVAESIDSAPEFFYAFAFLTHRLVRQEAYFGHMDMLQCLVPTSVVRCTMAEPAPSDHQPLIKAQRDKLIADYEKFLQCPPGR